MANVDIVLPDGGGATVPEGDLGRALAAGAKVAQTGPAAGSDAEFVNSGLGQALTGILGAGRAASFGATDVIATRGADLFGGESAQRDVAKAFRTAKEANPYADIAGETAGLFLGGGGLTAIGEAAEAGVAARVGESLLGKVAAGAGRGLAEGTTLAVQHQITEDAIGDGDHARSGEAWFTQVGKEALLGGAIGAATGGIGYGLGRLFGKGTAAATEAAEKGALSAAEDVSRGLGPYRTPGPLGTSAVDELVGQKGAGVLAKESARSSEEAIAALRKTGLTGEQATEMIDGANRVADAAAAAKGATKTDVGDAIAGWYAKAIGGKDPEAVAALQRHYGIQRGLRDTSEDFLRTSASKTAKQLTDVFRNVEDIANESDFVMKGSRMKRLMKDVDVDQAGDVVSKMLQRVHEVTGELATSTEGATAKRIAKRANEIILDTIKKPGADAADIFIAGDKLNRMVGEFVPHSLPQTQMTQLQRFMSDTYASFRETLRDESVWGAGGRAQAAANDAFAGMKTRRDDMARTLASTLDRGERGVKLASGDFEKVEGMFRKLTGHETDAELEGIKSVEAFIDGSRQRIGVVREFGDLSAEQAAKLTAGEKSLNAFEQSFRAAREEVSANNRVRSMQLVERERPAVGGLLGLIGDVVTKPLNTLDRLASVQNTVERVIKKVRGAAEGAVDGSAVSGAAAKAASKDAVGKEIGHIAELAGNPERLSRVVTEMFSGIAKTAPKIAAEAQATAVRAVTFLAKEAPIPIGSRIVFGTPQDKPRYSDAQLASWQSKRDAAMGALDGRTAPEVIVGDLQKGRLNRDAIRTIEFVSPRLFAEMQQTARDQISKMAADGKLDTLTLQQQAAIASLLKVPPGQIWKPDFMMMMQSAKSYTQYAEQNKSQGAPMGGASKRAIKLDTDVFQTDAQAIGAR